MLKLFEKLSSVLSLPAGYQIFQRMVGMASSQKTYLAEHAKPAPAEKILDLGCGPADVLEHLPNANYTGLDISPEYIRAARARFGSRARFYCGDVGLATIEGELGTFDLVMAIGVVHHLDDAQAAKLFGLARRVLRPGGRLVTYDGCYVPKQSPIARWMLAHDRGKFVRTEEEYLRLASAHFSKVTPQIRQDLLVIPYTHLIMRCSA